MLGDRSQAAAKRVVRGGSWNNKGRNARSAMRNRNSPDNRRNNLGFRLALAQYATGVCVSDQIVIRFCALFRVQAKSKVPGMLVRVWMDPERLPVHRPFLLLHFCNVS